MKIKLNSVLVDDQDRALKFYTEVLGFVKKQEIPVGEFKWLTVVSPEEPDSTELVLEPMGFQPASTYQKALFEAGIPLTAFAVADIQKEYERMKKLGVLFEVSQQKWDRQHRPYLMILAVTLFRYTRLNIQIEDLSPKLQ
jgi:catechol 2,3-dioxygenase-like lactoylglutathione lyase family enzyme